MARLVYACRFDVPDSQSINPLAERYVDWITAHYQKRLKIDRFKFPTDASDGCEDLPPRHQLSSESFADEVGDVVRHIKWAVPHDTDHGLVWINDVRLGQVGSRAIIEHTIAIQSIEYRVEPVRLTLGSPRVVRELCTQGIVSIGDMRIQATPYPVRSGEVAKLIELLESPARVLPLVLVAPYGDGTPNEINSTELARRLAGVAILVHLQSVESTWDLTDELGRTLSCFDGGVRIYWPHFSRDDRPLLHPLFVGSRISAIGSGAITRSIEQAIFSVAATRFSPDPAVSAVMRNVDRARRAKQIEARGQATGSEWENYAIELDGKLTSALQKISDLEAEVSSLKANQEIFLGRQDEAASAIASADNEFDPESIVEAVEFAKANFKNVVVLDSAIEAASESPFRRPADIHALLSDLNEVADALVSQRLDGGEKVDVRQRLAEKGWGKRCTMRISNTTRTTHGSSYTFEYNGKRMIFEPHVTIGSGDANVCASVHFTIDEQNGKIVIGHVGRHLPNTKS